MNTLLTFDPIMFMIVIHDVIWSIDVEKLRLFTVAFKKVAIIKIIITTWYYK